MDHFIELTARRTVWALVLLCGLGTAAPAGVLHPSGDPFAGDKPVDAVVGRWGSNASCVAIGEQYIITTRHQGGGVGNVSVVFGAGTYDVAEIFAHSAADLRVVRLEPTGGAPAVLGSWVDVYAGTDEVGKTAVIGGYGKRRGSTLLDGNGDPYAYDWTGAANDILTWGRQNIDGTEIASGMDVLSADFDAADAPEDPGNARQWVEHELGLASWDSGGGVFLKDGVGGWDVAGLGRTVERIGESRFRSPITGDLDPDSMDAVRLSSYAPWIGEVLARSEWTLDGDGDWSAGAHWTSPAAPNAQDKVAVLGTAATGPVEVTLDAAARVGTLRFEGSEPYTLSGDETLALDVGSDRATVEAVDHAGTATHTIATDLNLMDSLVVRVEGDNGLVFAGALDGGGAAVWKTGAGIATFNAASSFDGGTQIDGGTVRVTDAAGLGTGPVEIGDATLVLVGDADTDFGNDLSVVNDATIEVARETLGPAVTHTLGDFSATTAVMTATDAGGGGLLFDGETHVGTFSADDVTIDTASADVTFAGETEIRGKLTKRGPNALTLGGAQSHHFSAELWVEGGTVLVQTNAGTPATPGGAADAPLDLHIVGSKVGLGADQDIGLLEVLVGEAGDQELDLSGHMLRLYQLLDEGGDEIEDDLAGMIALANGGTATGGDGIYDSQAGPDERIGYTDLYADAHGDAYIAVLTVFAGDANMDGKVDSLDSDILQASMGQSEKNWDEGDFNYDRVVDADDEALLQGNLGKTGGNAVPEPATLGLVLSGLWLGAGLRKRRRFV